MGAREALLGAATPTEQVHIKAIDATFIVRGMTGVERDKFEAACIKGKGKNREFVTDNIRAKLVAFCCIEADGSRTFSDEDVVAIGETRADVLARLADVAQRLSGITDEDVDELGKSSEKTAASSTPSSPSPNASV